jgi:hypothetical protein
LGLQVYRSRTPCAAEAADARVVTALARRAGQEIRAVYRGELTAADGSPWGERCRWTRYWLVKALANRS